MLFHKKSRIQPEPVPEGKTPVIKASICTGEKVAGFQDTATGAFEDVMLVASPEDMRIFRERYGIQGEIRTIY